MTTLMTEQQAAGYLGGVSVRTLQRWRMTGEGPAFTKIGKCVRYRTSDLDRFLEANLRSSTSEVVHAE